MFRLPVISPPVHSSIKPGYRILFQRPHIITIAVLSSITPIMSSQATRTSNKFQEVTKGLKKITAHSIDSSQVHIENSIGSVQVPVGLAGPLLVREIGKAGEQKGEEVYAPLATTEAALIASCSRGCKVFSRSGGVYITSLSDTMSRYDPHNNPSVGSQRSASIERDGY